MGQERKCSLKQKDRAEDVDGVLVDEIFGFDLFLNDFGVSISLLRRTTELRDTSDQQKLPRHVSDSDSDQNRKFLTENMTY